MRKNNHSAEQDEIIEIMPISYMLLNMSGIILKTNSFLQNLLGYSSKKIMQRNFQEIIANEHFIFSEFVEKNEKTKDIKGIELKLKCNDGNFLYTLFNATFVEKKIHCVFVDITEKIMLYEKLGEAMELIGRTITICSNCKKIKTGQGEWDMVENFFWKKIKTRFSHGLCPGCVEELYPELRKK